MSKKNFRLTIFEYEHLNEVAAPLESYGPYKPYDLYDEEYYMDQEEE